MSTEISKQSTGIQLQTPPDQPISDQTLSQYGRKLGFDDKFLRKANEVCKKVCDSIKNTDFKPERVSVSESHVCQEGVEDTGVDIVAYLKESPHDMSQVKSKFEEVIKGLGAQKLETDDKGVLHFDLDNVKVNLGMAVSRGPTTGEHRKAVFQQVVKRSKEGKLEKSQAEKVSVDLHDSMSEFMSKPQDDFDLAAQRLARAWRRTALAPWGDWLSPLDATLIMQRALDNERQRTAGTMQMRDVMRRFFNDIRNIEDMQLTFPDTSMYDWEIVPQWIQEERPLLLDPVNPFRNPFSGLNREIFRDIRNKAQEALSLVERSANMRDLFQTPPETEKRGA
jgi:hypothetical protein